MLPTGSKQTDLSYLHMTTLVQTMAEQEANIVYVLKVNNIHAYITTVFQST